MLSFVSLSLLVLFGLTGGMDSTTTAGPSTTTSYSLPTIMSCGTGKRVAFTFDDGPAWTENATREIMDTLEELGEIKVTFYLSPAVGGDNATLLARKCAIVYEMASAGHDIQSHSWTHTSFDTLTNEQIVVELNNTKNWIEECSDGMASPTIFRPPYGALSLEKAQFIAQDLGYIISVWNVDSDDWRTPNNFSVISGNINERVDYVGGDSVNMLMHDVNSYQIVSDIYALFEDEYEFITSTECWEQCDTLDRFGICRNANGFGMWVTNGWDLPTTTQGMMMMSNTTEMGMTGTGTTEAGNGGSMSGSSAAKMQCQLSLGWTLIMVGMLFNCVVK